MLKDLLSIPSPPSTKQELRGASWFEEAITRLVVAMLLEQNDEWAVQRACYNDPGNHRAAEQ